MYVIYDPVHRVDGFAAPVYSSILNRFMTPRWLIFLFFQSTNFVPNWHALCLQRHRGLRILLLTE